MSRDTCDSWIFKARQSTSAYRHNNLLHNLLPNIPKSLSVATYSTEDLPTLPTSLFPQTYLRHQIITCMLQPSSWCLSFFMAKSPANIKIREAGSTASVLSTNAILIMHARILMFNHPYSLVDYVSHTPGEKLWLRSCPGSKQWFIVTYLYECRAMNHGTHTKLIKKATFLIVIV